MPYTARELHRERGATLASLAAGNAPCAAHQRSGVHAGVRVEAAVFVQQHRIDQRGRDALERHPQAVLVVASEREAQQLAALRIDRARAADGFAQCGMGPEAEQGEQQRDDREGDERPARPGSTPSPACGRGLG